MMLKTKRARERLGWGIYAGFMSAMFIGMFWWIGGIKGLGFLVALCALCGAISWIVRRFSQWVNSGEEENA